MSSSTSTSVSSNESDDYTPAVYEVKLDDTLNSGTTEYQIVAFIGEGTFGKVATCINSLTGEQVAVKIINTNFKERYIKNEVKVLEAIRSLGADKNNIVEFIEHFRFKSHSCLAFEILDRSLWDLMEETHWSGLSLNEMRPIVHQLMEAFAALDSIGIIHADLKLDNVMLVSHKDQPFRIKLIDFGVAEELSKVDDGMLLQHPSFRAPEVNLGLPLTVAIDMWSLGCMMVILYFGQRLFPSDCPYNVMRYTVLLFGQPDDHLLNAGMFTEVYFSPNDNPHNPGWRMNSADEFQEISGIEAKPPPHWFFDSTVDLEDAVKNKNQDKKSDIEYEDGMAFLSLLMSTFELDPEKRISPRESLKNPFLSMVHLKNKTDTCSYSDEALQCMTVLPLNNLSDNSDRAEEEEEEKEDLTQVDNVELQGAHTTNKEKVINELQVCKDRNKLLQEELEQLRNSYQMLNARYENEVPTISEQVLQDDLNKEREKNKCLQDQLDNMTASLNEVNLRYQTDVTDVRQQADQLSSDLERERKEKKLLQTAYKELQEAHRLDQEKFSAYLEAEKKKIEIFQQNLDKIRTSEYEVRTSLYKIIHSYETHVIKIKQQADALCHQLDKDIVSHEDSVSEDRHALRAEQEAPHQMEEEITILTEKEEISEREPDELQNQFSVQLSHNLKLSNEIKAESEALQQSTILNAHLEPTEGAEHPEEMPCEQQEAISPAPALESQRGAEGSLPNRRTEPPSVWKRVRHFLGLRKPERWKRRRREEEN